MRIDISPGDPSWEAAEKLKDIVWPPHVMDTIVWREVAWARLRRVAAQATCAGCPGDMRPTRVNRRATVLYRPC